MPIHFTCPHCGVETDVDDQYGGQTIPCIGCKQTISFPESDGATPPATMVEPTKRRSRHRFTLIELLLVLAIIGVLSSVMLPARSQSRESARRVQCVNNLKQIGLAIHNYHDKYHCFPPAYLADENGKPMHSWRVLILPFLGREDLYSRYRFDEPWDGPHNRLLADQMPPEYRCPTGPGPETAHGMGTTSYALIVGPHAFSDGPAGRRAVDIKDGLSKTIMMAEAAGAGINWLEPRDLDAATMAFRIRHPGSGAEEDASEISSCHLFVANVLFCDGSVRSLTDDISAEDLKALTTIDGGEHADMPN